MCAPPFATKQRPPIWKILDPPLNFIIRVKVHSQRSKANAKAKEIKENKNSNVKENLGVSSV